MKDPLDNKPLFDIAKSEKSQEILDNKKHQEFEREHLEKQNKLVSEQIKITNKQNKTIRNQNYIILAYSLIALFSLGYGIFIGQKQATLIDAQLESIAPLKPSIVVLDELDFPEDRKISIYQIADIYKDNSGKETFARSHIRFIVINEGRIKSNTINAELTSDIVKSSGGYIEKLDGESYDYMDFTIRYKECREEQQFLEDGTMAGIIVNPNCEYKPGSIPLGWYRFNLTLSCDFCEKEPIFYDFCIYDGTENAINKCNSPPGNLDT